MIGVRKAVASLGKLLSQAAPNSFSLPTKRRGIFTDILFAGAPANARIRALGSPVSAKAWRFPPPTAASRDLDSIEIRIFAKKRRRTRQLLRATNSDTREIRYPRPMVRNRLLRATIFELWNMQVMIHASYRATPPPRVNNIRSMKRKSRDTRELRFTASPRMFRAFS